MTDADVRALTAHIDKGTGRYLTAHTDWLCFTPPNTEHDMSETINREEWVKQQIASGGKCAYGATPHGVDDVPSDKAHQTADGKRDMGWADDPVWGLVLICKECADNWDETYARLLVKEQERLSAMLEPGTRN